MNTIGPPPTGLGWDENCPAIDDVYGNALFEIRDLRKGVRIRLEKEHRTIAVAGVGGEHKQGSAIVYVGDYSAAWPTLKPDGVTTLDTNDSGRLALDTTTIPNRIAIYKYGTGWITIGQVVGNTLITSKLQLLTNVSYPASVANYGFVFTKDITVNSITTTELFYIDSNGLVKQFTSGGKLNLVAVDITDSGIDDQKIRLRNAQYLRGRNAANDGDISLIGAGRNEADDTNVPVLPDKVRTATNAAPLENTSVANKKYIDDKIATITVNAFKVIAITRNMADASGDVSVTGIGFQPSALICMSAILQGIIGQGFGMGTAGGSKCIYFDNNANYAMNADVFIKITTSNQSDAANQSAVIKSMDTDGFTLTWTKTSAPTGTTTMIILAIK